MGTLIAQRAVRNGHRPILAGRREKPLNAIANTLDLPSRSVCLKDPDGLRSALDDVPAVLHCAGPFSRTAGPMVAACLETGTHYLDITGEIPVFQALMDRGSEAEENGVILLPGVGFDVVATDCLARFLSEEASSATTLEIAFTVRGGVSKGTLKTVVEQMGMGGLVRRNGELATVPAGWTTRTVHFGDHPRTVISIPWADLVTASHSTDIPNVTVYTYLPQVARQLLRLSRYVQGLLAWRPLQRILQGAIDRWVPNPSPEGQRRARTWVWVSVRDADGKRRTARLEGPGAYAFTVRAAVQAIDAVRDGGVEPGFQTPSTAFGPGFVRDLEGVRWMGGNGEG